MADLFDSQINPQDEEFRFIRDEPRFKEQKDLLERFWKQYQPYADPGFKDKLAKRFHHHFWEMYLACTLLYQDHVLVSKRREKGPDICISKGNSCIWIEACAPGPGEGPDAIPLPRLGEAEYVPEEKIVLRLRAAIHEKWKKYKEYLASGTVSHPDPYVIAINGAYVSYSSSGDLELPYIVQAVSRIGPRYATLNRETLEVVDEGYAMRPKILKMSRQPVSTDIFLEKEYEGISGVLFSRARVGNLPYKLGGEFVFVHNPRTLNPLPRGCIKAKREFWCKDDLWIEG